MATGTPALPTGAAFEGLADRYDAWYDSPEGASIFRDELACLRFVCPECRGRWLEVGVGTGRFAAALAIGEGLDPSLRMLEYAVRRGIRTMVGVAERVPLAQGTLDGVLMALALCFVQDAVQAAHECARVLRPSGTLLLGIIPADGPWGLHYARKAAEGHPVYSLARFRSVRETVALVEGAGFVLRASASALFRKPGGMPECQPRVESGMVAGAGFAALRFGVQPHRRRGRAGRGGSVETSRSRLAVIPYTTNPAP